MNTYVCTVELPRMWSSELALGTHSLLQLPYNSPPFLLSICLHLVKLQPVS